MIYFLQQSGLKEIIPGAAIVEESIAKKEQIIDSYFDQLVRGLMDYAPKVISAIIVLFLGLWLIKRVALLAEKSMTRRKLDVSLRTFFKSLINVGLKIILVITVAGMIGIGTASFVTILGAAGLAVGLALQGSLSNFAGGVLLLIFKPFKVGDLIEAGGQSGEVVEIQIFNSILLTADHKTVILPNGPLSNGTIINITRYGSLRLDIQLSISSSNNLIKVNEIIQEVLYANSRVLKTPAPGVFVGKIIDGAVQVSVKPFCANGDAPVLTSDLYAEIKHAFEKNKISPARPLRLVQTVEHL